MAINGGNIKPKSYWQANVGKWFGVLCLFEVPGLVLSVNFTNGVGWQIEEHPKSGFFPNGKFEQALHIFYLLSKF